MSSSPLFLHTDGGARGNPGPAAAGIIFHDQKGTALHAFSKYLGTTTNNQAEYQALILALSYLKEHPEILSPTTELRIFMDSELIIRQLQGHYKIKHPDIKPLAQQVFDLLNKLHFPTTFTHVPRAQNSQADALVNEELDRQQ